MSNITLENFHIMNDMMRAIKLFVSSKNNNIEDFFKINHKWIIWAEEFDLSKEQIKSMIGSETYCQNNPKLVKNYKL